MWQLPTPWLSKDTAPGRPASYTVTIGEPISRLNQLQPGGCTQLHHLNDTILRRAAGLASSSWSHRRAPASLRRSHMPLNCTQTTFSPAATLGRVACPLPGHSPSAVLAISVPIKTAIVLAIVPAIFSPAPSFPPFCRRRFAAGTRISSQRWENFQDSGARSTQPAWHLAQSPRRLPGVLSVGSMLGQRGQGNRKT